MKTLGIDFGEKRIGLAIASSLFSIAQPLSVLKRKNIEADIKELEEIVKEYGIEEIVLGLPLNMNGSKGRKAQEAIDFGELLKKRLKLKVSLYDERLSTVEGERVLLQADLTRAKRRNIRDKIAAQIILQSYLDLKELKQSG